MNGDIVYGDMQMARGAFVRLEQAEGVLLQVRDGELWITQEGDRRDYYVKAGESFRLDRDGTALACALAASNVSLSAPMPARPQPAGRLERLRRRLARGWANAYAPFSRSTTAAL